MTQIKLFIDLYTTNDNSTKFLIFQINMNFEFSSNYYKKFLRRYSIFLIINMMKFKYKDESKLFLTIGFNINNNYIHKEFCIKHGVISGLIFQ